MSCANLAGVRFQDKPANGPHCKQSSSSQPKSTLKSLAFTQRPVDSAPKAMQCKQDVLPAFFLSSTCPLGEQCKYPSMAPQVELKREIRGPCCRENAHEANCRLLNTSWRYYNIFVGISSPFFVYFHQFYHFLAVMISSGDLVSQPCAQWTWGLKYVL